MENVISNTGFISLSGYVLQNRMDTAKTMKYVRSKENLFPIVL